MRSGSSAGRSGGPMFTSDGRERERLDEPFGLVVTIVWDFSLQTLWAAATASSSRLGDEIGTP